jgi:hypothetical protein
VTLSATDSEEELEVSACKRLDFKPGTSTTVRADSDAQGLPQLEAGGVGSLSMTASVCALSESRRASKTEPLATSAASLANYTEAHRPVHGGSDRSDLRAASSASG